MSDRITVDGLAVDKELYTFINEEALPGTGLDGAHLWAELSKLVHEFAPKNRALLAKRDDLQNKVDDWHKQNGMVEDMDAYKAFLSEIGYLVPDLERLAATNLMALSPGAVFADVPNIKYTRVKRPIFPQDPAMSWAPPSLPPPSV